MKVTGARYKNVKGVRQPPQNIRIKKMSKPLFKAEQVSGSANIQTIKVQGRELISSEHKKKSDSSVLIAQSQKRSGTQEGDRPMSLNQKLRSITNADVSTAAESSLGQSNESYVRLPLKDKAGVGAQIQKQYVEQLKLQEKPQRNISGKANSKVLGISSNSIISKLDKSGCPEKTPSKLYLLRY